jgi:hypothetical protein
MLFFLSTPGYNKSQLNTTKVKVHLQNGVAEIFDNHQDLMGLVSNNIVEIESNFENKFEKNTYIVQDAVFVVSTKGLGEDDNFNYTGTRVYVYAKNVRELTRDISTDELTKEYDSLSSRLEILEEELKQPNLGPLEKILKGRVLLLKSDLGFYAKTLLLVKEMKSQKS